MEREVVQSEADRYVIVEYIAEGGMGAIFLGKKIGLEGFEKEVVLKQLLPEFTSQREFIDLFLREAKLSALLDHANIVNTIDLVAAGDDYFIVMEYVRGGDLRTILKRIKQRGNNLHPAAALFVAREVLSALAYAHEKKDVDGNPLNLIHRDISPSNIMVSGAGEVKLTDFGIAKVSTHKSVFYRVKGKVGYMSPEQAYGDRPIDRRSDLYSLGVCFYEMVAGERLFVADLLSTPDQIYSQPLPSLESYPGVPAGIDRVLAKALAFKPEDRFQTALEFQDALVQVAFESGMIFTPPDVAKHFKEVCGEDPRTWNQEEEDLHRPGTEVLDEEASQFSGVALTSIFTALPQQLGPDPLRGSGLLGPDAGPAHTSPRRDPIAFAPTRLVPEHAIDPNLRTAEQSFDFSDYDAASDPYGHRPRPDAFEEIDRPNARGEAAAGPQHQVDALPPAVSWPVDEEDDEPTVAVDSLPDHPIAEDSPLPLGPELTDEDGVEPAPPPPGLEPAATVELRVAQRRGRVPGGSADPGNGTRPVRRTQPRERSGGPEPDPVLTTGRVSPPHAGPAPGTPVGPFRVDRHRLLVIIAVGLLLLAGGAIVALVGLTGPDLDDLRGNRPPGGTSRKDGSSALSSPLVIPSASDSTASDTSTAVPRSPDQRVEISPAPTPPPDRQARALKVESSPSNAKVYLDSVYQCKTPCTIEELEGRVYLLSVRRTRYVSWSSLVDMKGKLRVHINAYLSEEPNTRSVGYLMIRSRPHADVYVDGKEIGRVTSEGRIPLPPGQYEIMLSHPRHRRQPKFVITIQARKTYLLMPKF